MTVAGPCAPRAPFRGGGIDGTVQRIVLDGLDRAACKLGTTREQLVLSLAPGSGVVLPRSRQAADGAVRAGMLSAVDAAVRRGEVPALLAPPLHAFVRHAPLERIVEGGIRLSDLLG